MKATELAGKVQTVLGVIVADSLGITLTHEHLPNDMSAYFVEPTEASDKKLVHQAVTHSSINALMENPQWDKVVKKVFQKR